MIRKTIEMNDSPLPLIKASLWGTDTDKATRKDYNEMSHQAIISLPGALLASLEMPQELQEEWKNAIIQQLSFNEICKFAQSKLPLTVPYVILKGTSAAQYYPIPDYRPLGDIDIITRREDVETACETLLKNGYKEVTSNDDILEGRHRSFLKYGIPVEVHYFFAAMNEPEKAKIFDDLIIDQINDTHILPDQINGLVLIEHINQHLENGLGLRQIIDWMMYVDKCLADEEWRNFQKLVNLTGLETLTIVVTRMCEMYLGLSPHTWAKDADKKLCSMLMSYVMESGNFGNQRTIDERMTFIRYTQSNHPIRSIRELQRKGAQEWGKAQKPICRPFAWLWKGLQVARKSSGLRVELNKAKKRKRMLVALGAKRKDMGIAIYKEGKYFVSR